MRSHQTFTAVVGNGGLTGRWQANRERAATARRAIDRHTPTMRGHDVTDHREADAGAVDTVMVAR